MRRRSHEVTALGSSLRSDVHAAELAVDSPPERRPAVRALILAGAIAILPRPCLSDSGAGRAPVVSVPAIAETDPVPHGKDAADDPSIWLHPTQPSLSTIIGTDKQGGLAVYDLDGRQIQYLGDDPINNVDLRYGFPFGDRTISIVTAGNRARAALSVYRVDPETRHLESIGEIPVGDSPVGTCMYHSKSSDEFYGFVTFHDAVVEQWRLFERRGGIEGELARSFRVRAVSPEMLATPGFSGVEGCVADDETGFLYLAEEDVALWKYLADPGIDDTWRTPVHLVREDGLLTPDIEGLAIYHGSRGEGYLIVSNQEVDEFAVFRREGDNSYVGSFSVSGSGDIDEVTHTDGIEVTNLPLGPRFPFGVFVAQDDDNRPDHQNFKLVPWDSIARAFSPPLIQDPSSDPRLHGASEGKPGFWKRLWNSLKAGR